MRIKPDAYYLLLSFVSADYGEICLNLEIALHTIENMAGFLSASVIISRKG